MWTHLTPSALFCFSCLKSLTPKIIAKVYQGCLYLHDHGVVIVHGADYDPNSVSEAVQVRHDWQPGIHVRLVGTRTLEHVLISQKSKRRRNFVKSRDLSLVQNHQIDSIGSTSAKKLHEMSTRRGTTVIPKPTWSPCSLQTRQGNRFVCLSHTKGIQLWPATLQPAGFGWDRFIMLPS